VGIDQRLAEVELIHLAVAVDAHVADHRQPGLQR
jgi:hypothetical protein